MSEIYGRLFHAMQTGVAYDLEKDSSSGSPKQLRVGVNSALVNDAAIAGLLIQKGIITMKECVCAVEMEMALEVGRYENMLEQQYGIKVTLA